MTRVRAFLGLTTLLMLTIAAPASALNSCVLSGIYAASATVVALDDVDMQLSGYFTFDPPIVCSEGAPGTVYYALEAVPVGSSSPIPVTGNLPYVVDSLGVLTVGDTLLEGLVSHIAGDIAHSVPFVTHPLFTPASCKFAGVATRVDLAVAGLPGPPGLTGATGPAGPGWAHRTRWAHRGNWPNWRDRRHGRDGSPGRSGADRPHRSAGVNVAG